MFSSNPRLTDSQRRSLNRRILDLDLLINAESATVPLAIEQFKAAAINGEPHTADIHRQELLEIQGRIMDHIYARATLMRQAGYI